MVQQKKTSLTKCEIRLFSACQTFPAAHSKLGIKFNRKFRNFPVEGRQIRSLKDALPTLYKSSGST